MEHKNKRSRDKYENDSSYVDEDYENEMKKMKMDNNIESMDNSDDDSTIEKYLRKEGILGNDDEDVGGKTISINELDKIINEDSIDYDEKEIVDSVMHTPTKQVHAPAPCLSENPSVSAKRIHFGSKSTVDFTASDPVTSLTPQKARIESNLSTSGIIFKESEMEDSPETSRNSSYLAQFDNEPDIPTITRQSQKLRASIASVEDSDDDDSLLTSISGLSERRKTADIDELHKLLGRQSLAPSTSQRTSLQPSIEDNQEESSIHLINSIKEGRNSSPLKDDPTARLSKIDDILDTSTSSLSDMKGLQESSLNEEETVALQNLIETSAMHNSTMDISQVDSDTTDLQDINALLKSQSKNQDTISRDSITTSSRRNTMSVGEMKSRLMNVLENYEQRMSMASETEPTITDSLSSQPLDHLLQSNNQPLQEDSSELDTTLELQQYAAQLRAEMDPSSVTTDTKKKDSPTKELSDAMKDVFGENTSHAVSNLQQTNQVNTDAILSRINHGFSNEGILEADQTVTEDLKRLSQLLQQAQDPHLPPEPSQASEEKNQETEKIHFSPLITQSGTKQVLVSIRSNSKYVDSPEHEIQVIDKIVGRSLFQDSDSEPEPEPEPEPEVKRVQESSSQQKENAELDNSLNLDDYFLPKASHSLLDDTTVKSLPFTETSPREEPMKPIQPKGFEDLSDMSLPSPIMNRSMNEESSISSISSQHISPVKNSQSNPSPVKQPAAVPSQEQPIPIDTPSQEQPIDIPSQSQPITIPAQEQLPASPIKPTEDTPTQSTSIPTSEVSTQPPQQYHPSEAIQSKLQHIHSFNRKLTGVLFELSRIRDMKEDIEILQSKRKEIIEKKKEEEKVVKEVESVKETVKRMKIELAEETKKSDMILQQQQQHQKLQQQTPSQEEDDEKKIKELQQFIQRIEEELGISIRVLSTTEYRLILSDKKQILARIQVRMISTEEFSIQVMISPIFSRSIRKRFEQLLPLTQEKKYPIKNMTEIICRIIWILCHIE